MSANGAAGAGAAGAARADGVAADDGGGAAVAAVPAPAASSGGTGAARFGRFELRERIGEGGMGEVYRAVVRGPEGFSRELVVKRILPELMVGGRFTQMFVNEAKISALLAHPNIVQIYEFGEFDGSYFISMESVRGTTLRAALARLRERGRRLPPVVAAEVARQVLVGLEYAHNLRSEVGQPLEIVHRDISPANIMLADSGTVKILDFGIARAVHLAAEDEGHLVKGKAAYLAPEQMACGAVDGRADLYALGCVFYEMLVGRQLFPVKNDILRRLTLLEEAVPAPSSMNPDVPPALDRIVLRALARRPEARYRLAAEMLADVEDFLVSFRSPGRELLRLLRSLSDDEATAMGAPVAGAGAAGGGGVAGRGFMVSGPTRAEDGATVHMRPEAGGGGGGEVLPHPMTTQERAEARERERRRGESGSGGNGKGSAMGQRQGGEGDDRTPMAVAVDPPSLTFTPMALPPRVAKAISDEERRQARQVLKRRVAVGALVAVAAMGLLRGGSWVWNEWDARAEAQRVAAEKAAAEAAAAAAAQGKAPAQTQGIVLVTIESSPSGAKVIAVDNKQLLGRTPTTLPVPAGTGALRYRLERGGYQPKNVVVVPDRDRTLQVELRAARRSAQKRGER